MLIRPGEPKTRFSERKAPLRSASTTLPLSRLVPLWVLLLSYFCLRTLERIGWREAVAAALVVLGAALITAFR